MLLDHWSVPIFMPMRPARWCHSGLKVTVGMYCVAILMLNVTEPLVPLAMPGAVMVRESRKPLVELPLPCWLLLPRVLPRVIDAPYTEEAAPQPQLARLLSM